jgi:acetoin utilization protein AcuC
MPKLTICYSDAYLNWKLGGGDGKHPTNPIRARLAVQMLEDELPELGVDFEVIEPTFKPGDRKKLLEVHSASHVSDVLDRGKSYQWADVNKKNAKTAGLMFGGTVRLVEKMLADVDVRVGFNPQGAKHHAHRDYSSGFCVFNDMAWAALEFERAGLKVVYIDWDVHAGDGVQALLENTNIPTFSIHGHGIFPNLSYTSVEKQKHSYLYMDQEHHWFNYNLQQGSGDDGFAWAIEDIMNKVSYYSPDVVLLAAGADGHEGEGWGIKYTLDGYKYAAEKVVEMANLYGARVLIGGAGGYQPFNWTPRIWAEVVKTIAKGLS